MNFKLFECINKYGINRFTFHLVTNTDFISTHCYHNLYRGKTVELIQLKMSSE